MRSILSLGLGLYLITSASAQENPIARKYGDLVSLENLRKNLSIVAADSMEGRETGTKGEKMAAEFIKKQFQNYNLTGPVDGNYFQQFELSSVKSGDSYVRAKGEKFLNFQDLIYFGRSTTKETTLPLVVLTSETQLENSDVKGKAVLMLTNSTRVSNNPLVTRAKEKGGKALFVCNSKTDEDFRSTADLFKNYMSSRLTLEKQEETATDGIFILSPKVVKALTGKTVDELRSETQSKKPVSASVTYRAETLFETVKTENVLGYLEGTEKKDEVLVVTAHYDHIGMNAEGSKDMVNNGADDDGSGTVTVLELARIFAQAKADGNGPKRSILFMTVTGEEEGLLGSDYYTQHPVFPLSNTVVNLNIDMIGRTDKEHEGKPDYVYVIGSDKLSSELHTLSESVNQTYTQLDFDYLYNDEHHPTNLYKRSDHWNFAKNNVPIIFYFDGIHEDYHKASDEVDKIQFDLLAKRVRTVFYTAWEIANREKRIVPDKN